MNFLVRSWSKASTPLFGAVFLERSKWWDVFKARLGNSKYPLVSDVTVVVLSAVIWTLGTASPAAVLMCPEMVPKVGPLMPSAFNGAMFLGSSQSFNLVEGLSPSQEEANLPNMMYWFWQGSEKLNPPCNCPMTRPLGSKNGEPDEPSSSVPTEMVHIK